MSKSDRVGDAALAVTVLTWASAFPAIRVGLDGYGPWALALLRLLVASAVLGAVALFAGLRLPPGRRGHGSSWPGCSGRPCTRGC